MDDHRAIERVLLNYCAGIDRLDGALLGSCFTADAAIDYGAAGAWNGGDELVAYMIPRHRALRKSQHRLHNVMIDVDGDRATARSYVDAVLLVADGSLYRNPIAEYDDEFRRIDGQWKIARRTTTVLFIREVSLT